MKRIVISFCLMFVVAFSMGQSWVKEKQKDGIIIYNKISDQYRMKTARAEMFVDAPVDKVIATIFNVKDYVKWMPDCAKIDLLKTIGSNELIYYALFTTPWPAASRDMVIDIKKSEITGGYKILINNKSNYVEVKSDAVRIPIYFGEWRVVRTNLGTKITIEYQMDPGGSVPDWMIQGASTKSPYDMFEALKKYLKE